MGMTLPFLLMSDAGMAPHNKESQAPVWFIIALILATKSRLGTHLLMSELTMWTDIHLTAL